jgi:hypothetical protein
MLPVLISVYMTLTCFRLVLRAIREVFETVREALKTVGEAWDLWDRYVAWKSPRSEEAPSKAIGPDGGVGKGSSSVAPNGSGAAGRERSQPPDGEFRQLSLWA